MEQTSLIVTKQPREIKRTSPVLACLDKPALH